QMKSAAAVAALAVILGAGSYAGFMQFHHDSESQSISATVNDLQILDHNDQVISQLDVLDDGTDGPDTSQN
ncbi:MAG TPA: hypothetical protein VNX22_00330, partial [Acidobacteriaceae bacterium]|nr:hypothetical protein [Acidobacteriaceae bacterium]